MEKREEIRTEGYVQSIHGKGVRIIYQPGQQQSEFILGGIESLKEAVARNRKNYTCLLYTSRGVEETGMEDALGIQIKVLDYSEHALASGSGAEAASYILSLIHI